MIIEGRRGAPKIIIKNIPCGMCDFVAENFGQLMGHVEMKHPYPLIYSSSNYENSFKELKSQCSICGQEDYIRHLPEGRHLACYNKELFKVIKKMNENKINKIGDKYVKPN